MVKLDLFIDKEIYDKLVSACSELGIDNISKCAQIAFMFLIASVKKCRELNKQASECLFAILDVVEQTLKS